jgi:ribonuclease P protein component
MLPKQHRLDLRRETPFYTFSQKFHTRNFSLYWNVNGEQMHPTAAIVVPKKVAPTAVQRNKVKRVLRALLTSLFSTLSPNVQLVIHVKHVNVLVTLDDVTRVLTAKCSTALHDKQT